MEWLKHPLMVALAASILAGVVWVVNTTYESRQDLRTLREVSRTAEQDFRDVLIVMFGEIIENARACGRADPPLPLSLPQAHPKR